MRQTRCRGPHTRDVVHARFLQVMLGSCLVHALSYPSQFVFYLGKSFFNPPNPFQPSITFTYYLNCFVSYNIYLLVDTITECVLLCHST
ncbi:hypothetical protein F5Y17DRAFT_439263 [Xylariaceae sp. FL0594]|nr:hypothetical protein F5Y17DRAFT_439263 [Xylariaceae sp. FL0594]